ncbi:MAG: hypothetical protein IPG04_04455 [Polyangiaceae bacterium]|nr:hypothetical protein [Polyangiaceae bacterium]
MGGAVSDAASLGAAVAVSDAASLTVEAPLALWAVAVAAGAACGAVEVDVAAAVASASAVVVGALGSGFGPRTNKAIPPHAMSTATPTATTSGARLDGLRAAAGAGGMSPGGWDEYVGWGA